VVDELVVRLSVRAKPRASKSRIVRLTQTDGLQLEVALAAPPVDGAANAALLELLSEVLGVRKSALSLVQGATSKHKVVQVVGLSADTVAARLAHKP